MFPVY